MEKSWKITPKPDGTPYNLYTDGMRIYTTLDARLQRYAEEAVQEHIVLGCRKPLTKNGKKKKVGSHGAELRTGTVVEQSERYQRLKQRGKFPGGDRSDLRHSFAHDGLQLEWWRGRPEMSPLDSIKYYLTLLNTGFLAMDPPPGWSRPGGRHQPQVL